MTDVYLCNNRSSNAADVTLRGVNACSVATVTAGGPPVIRYRPRRSQIQRDEEEALLFAALI